MVEGDGNFKSGLKMSSDLKRRKIGGGVPGTGVYYCKRENAARLECAFAFVILLHQNLTLVKLQGQLLIYTTRH